MRGSRHFLYALVLALVLACFQTASATTTFTVIVDCGVCGEESEQAVMGSSNAVGQPDLDLRPAAPLRHALGLELMQCPHCGYVAHQLDEPPSDAVKNAVRGMAYRALRQGPGMTVPKKYACLSLLMETEHYYKRAGLAALKAAWGYDDLEDRAKADQWRYKAASLLNRSLADPSMAEEPLAPGMTESLLTDIHRRTGSFNQAVVECKKALLHANTLTWTRILNFQMDLIAQGDTKAHSLSELPQEREHDAPEPSGNATQSPALK